MSAKKLIVAQTADGREIHHPGQSSILLTATPGAGKSRSVVMPNAINFSDGSLCLCDPKGDIAAAAALYRQQVLGQDVHVNDAMGIIPEDRLPLKNGKPRRSGYDVLRFIREAGSPHSAAMVVANGLIIPSPREPHWTEGAALILGAYMLYAAVHEIDLEALWAGINDAEANKALLAWMAKSDDPFIAGQANAMIEALTSDSRDLAGQVSTMRVQLAATLGEKRIMAALMDGDYRFADMRKRPTTIFITLPGSLSKTHNRYLRLLLTCAIAEIEAGGTVR